MHPQTYCDCRQILVCISQAESATPTTKLELVELARKNLQDLEYLPQVSANMLPAVDIACTAGDQTFPVHSYVLMAASPFFGELVAEHFSHLLKGSCITEVLVVPLTDTTPQSALAAFLFMYQQCSFKEMPALYKRSKDIEDVTAMARFAHKWNVQQMLDACDACISKHMVNMTFQPSSGALLDAVITCAQVAEEIHLEDFGYLYQVDGAHVQVPRQ